MREGNPKRQTALGDTCVEVFSDGGSIPPASTTRLSLDAIRVPGSFSLRGFVHVATLKASERVVFAVCTGE